MSSSGLQFVPIYRDLFDKIDFPLSKDLAILDFGCGIGECVRRFGEAGYTAFGCDVEFPSNLEGPLKSYLDDGIVRRIDFSQDPRDQVAEFLARGRLIKTDEAAYHLPFEDNTFDFIFSNQVFEHVMDYPAALADLSRVIKPTATNIHIFPGR